VPSILPRRHHGTATRRDTAYHVTAQERHDGGDEKDEQMRHGPEVKARHPRAHWYSRRHPKPADG
jgi:hypothetical protein